MQKIIFETTQRNLRNLSESQMLQRNQEFANPSEKELQNLKKTSMGHIQLSVPASFEFLSFQPLNSMRTGGRENKDLTEQDK